MNTKVLLAASAIVLGAAGIAATFAPQELAAALRFPAAAALLIQLLGAVYFGFAMTNWMAKGSAIGGIYNRPLLVGNIAHWFIGTMALLRAGAYAPAAVYAVFAVGFGSLLFTSPSTRS